MHDELLNNSDAQKIVDNNMSKNKCLTIVSRVNGVYTEIHECRIIGYKSEIYK